MARQQSEDLGFHSGPDENGKSPFGNQTSWTMADPKSDLENNLTVNRSGPVYPAKPVASWPKAIHSELSV
ncbi:hypothetical protein HPP92_004141 [Vanilla planifolia]|uniref:Uncharacterized protein n=1 Tax=Vanilla planifolia TaxID=51239 RepID=A0A835VKK8_VANPL|nr:hypothetical protein HPP92_004578 [Vanilla planifolia]KAG0504069.1 hypothetical protein HPP92_004141 [Vanilla planifolia]